MHVGTTQVSSPASHIPQHIRAGPCVVDVSLSLSALRSSRNDSIRSPAALLTRQCMQCASGDIFDWTVWVLTSVYAHLWARVNVFFCLCTNDFSGRSHTHCSSMKERPKSRFVNLWNAVSSSTVHFVFSVSQTHGCHRDIHDLKYKRHWPLRWAHLKYYACQVTL